MITSINDENSLNLGKHCGKKSGQTVFVTGDYALLTFHADENQQNKGFLLLFTTTPDGKLNQKTDRFFLEESSSLDWTPSRTHFP